MCRAAIYSGRLPHGWRKMDEVKNIESGNDDVTTPDVPFLVHESALARMERQVKRLFILCMVIFIAFVGSNIGWLIYEAQFEDIVMTQTATTDGDSDIIQNSVGSGEVVYNGGESDANSKSP